MGENMHANIKRMTDITEFETSERCFIAEVANDDEDSSVSIARARVAPGVTTAWHKLDGVAERYIITQGKGLVEVDNLPPTTVNVGDVVRIPPNCPQRIQNLGEKNLLFFVVCSPRFTPECYIQLEEMDDLSFEAPFR